MVESCRFVLCLMTCVPLREGRPFSRLTNPSPDQTKAEELLLKGHANLRQILRREANFNGGVEKAGKTSFGSR